MTAHGGKKILITRSSGIPGEMIVRQLLSEEHSVRIAGEPRNAGDPGVEHIEGTLDDPEGLRKALDGVQGVCLVGFSARENPDRKAGFGKAVIDACRSKGIAHIVYISFCGSGSGTGVPLLDAMHDVEGHLERSGLSYTILRPAWYMESFVSPRSLYSIEKGVLAMALRPGRVLDLVSSSDVGRIVAEAFRLPDKFARREIDLAADRLTMEDIAAEISLIFGKRVEYREILEEEAVGVMGRDKALLFKWMDGNGLNGDILLAREFLRRFEIRLTTFRDFLLDAKSRVSLPKAA